MRTNIEIDDELMERALQKSGLRTKKAAVEEGLRLLIKISGRKDILALRGKIQWNGDLDKMREDLPLEHKPPRKKP